MRASEGLRCRELQFIRLIFVSVADLLAEEGTGTEHAHAFVQLQDLQIASVIIDAG